MSVRTVLEKELKNTSRAPAFWGGGVALALLAVLLAYSNQGVRLTSIGAVQQTVHLMTRILALLLPLVALVASYLAITGEREGGGIRFLLSVPNTRWDVFIGKLLSRLVIVAAGIILIYTAMASVSMSKHGAFPAGIIFGTLLLTLVYGSVFVNIGVAISAKTATRSRAIGSALTAYFVLVLLYIFPVFQISNAVRELHTTILGMDENQDLYNAVEYTTPYRAYQKATNLAVPTEFEQQIFRDDPSSGQATGSQATSEQATETAVEGATDLPFYLSDEFALVILAVWLIVPLVMGYWAFTREEMD